MENKVSCRDIKLTVKSRKLFVSSIALFAKRLPSLSTFKFCMIIFNQWNFFGFTLITCSVPHSLIAFITGFNDFPRSLSAYSTRGGVSLN